MAARIAVIGAGAFGEMHLRAFSQMQRDGRAELVGVADLDEALLARRAEQYGVKAFTSYQQMIEETRPDGISIATPDHLHREIALQCLSAGIHVLVEKPLDVSTEGCQEMIAAAESGGLLLQVDFHKRYDPYHRELHDMAASGCFGEILYGYAYMEDRIEVPRDWLRKWAAQTTPAWFLGVHLFDLIRWIAGSDAQSVSATGVKKKLVSLGIDTYDAIQAKVMLRSGASFSTDVSWVLPEGHEGVVNQGIRVTGTDGMMEVDTQDRGARCCLRKPTDGRPQVGSGMQTPNLGFFRESRDKLGRPRYSGYGIESIQDFAENVSHLIAGGSLNDLRNTYASGRDGLEASRIAVAVHRSMEAGGALVDVSRTL